MADKYEDEQQSEEAKPTFQFTHDHKIGLGGLAVQHYEGEEIELTEAEALELVTAGVLVRVTDEKPTKSTKRGHK